MPRLLRVVNDGLPEQPCALARSISEQIDGTGPSGPKLEADLDRYLLKIEEAAGKDVRTSILLLDKERGRLLHGAAPSLPKAYCDAIHGIVIGPSVGSCATAAYIGHAIFVTDVATDPLWVDFRDLALSLNCDHVGQHRSVPKAARSSARSESTIRLLVLPPKTRSWPSRSSVSMSRWPYPVGSR